MIWLFLLCLEVLGLDVSHPFLSAWVKVPAGPSQPKNFKDLDLDTIYAEYVEIAEMIPGRNSSIVSLILRKTILFRILQFFHNLYVARSNVARHKKSKTISSIFHCMAFKCD